MRFLGFWFVIELINGVGHRLWSIQHRRYTPGVITARVLLVLGAGITLASREPVN